MSARAMIMLTGRSHRVIALRCLSTRNTDTHAGAWARVYFRNWSLPRLHTSHVRTSTTIILRFKPVYRAHLDLWARARRHAGAHACWYIPHTHVVNAAHMSSCVVRCVRVAHATPIQNANFRAMPHTHTHSTVVIASGRTAFCVQLCVRFRPRVHLCEHTRTLLRYIQNYAWMYFNCMYVSV